MIGFADSAYDCCVHCLNSPRCGGAGYYQNTGICSAALTVDSCSGDVVSAEFVYNDDPDSGVRISNSACGQWGVATD